MRIGFHRTAMDPALLASGQNALLLQTGGEIRHAVHELPVICRTHAAGVDQVLQRTSIGEQEVGNSGLAPRDNHLQSDVRVRTRIDVATDPVVVQVVLRIEWAGITGVTLAILVSVGLVRVGSRRAVVWRRAYSIVVRIGGWTAHAEPSSASVGGTWVVVGAAV